MYLAEIDDILDKTLDKFMYLWILENKNAEIIDYPKLIKEPNFVKYQKDINLLLEYSSKLIDEKDVNKLVSKTSNINLIKNIVLKYVSYYLFLFIGINYNGKIESFNNNIIELSRAQTNYKLKIDNFFNTESNSNIIKTTNLMNEFIEYIEKTISNNKKDKLPNVKLSGELKEFLKSYGDDNYIKIVELYKNEIDKNKIVVQHNIIKIFIYLKLYKASEKKEIFNIIETTETSNGDFIFIDVVVPKSSFIDYNAIESILEPHQLKTNIPETIFELINENYSDNITETRKYFTDFDLKIQKLLDTHLIVPIVDDFLLYHKNNEKYEKQLSVSGDKKKKEDTKIKYIVNKISTVADYYKNPTEIKKLFYVPLASRNAVLTNTYEDLKIISKIKNIIKIDNENVDLLNDLINYRLYPYISFKEFKTNGFFFNPNKTIEAVRNCSINDVKKEKFDILQTRIISENMSVNIIGFAIINTSDSVDCVDVNSFVNICDETNNPLQVMKMLLENKIKNINFPNIKNKVDLQKNYFWLFDLDKQKYSVPYYDISPNMNKNDIVKILSAYLYDWVMECVINSIREDINTTHPKSITDYINDFDYIKHKFEDINRQQYSTNINELEYLMYYIKSKKVTDIYDYKEDEFPGLYGNVVKLPIVPKKKSPIIPVVKIKPDFKVISPVIKNKEEQIDIDLELEIEDTEEHINGVCQHIISWDKIGELKKQNDLRYSDLVYEFIQQYVEINPIQDFICKSCKSSINIKRYILDGSFDNSTQTYITHTVQVDTALEDFPEYEKLKTSIKSLDKIIDRISSIINFQGLFGASYTNKSKRKNIIKDSLDIIMEHNTYLKKASYLTNRDKFIKSFGINKNISNLYIFELENNIFIYSSKEKDFYKSVKFNNIISYVIILLMLELTDTIILSFINDLKICSYFIYKKIGHTLFENINIITNKSNDLKPIKDYPILCYIIYIMSCFVTKYNIWADTISTDANVIDKKKNFLIIQKSVINTIVEILNSILQVDAEKLKTKKIYLYEILQNKYYLKLKDLFKDFNLVRKLDKMYLSDGTIKQQKQVYIDSSKFDVKPELSNIFNEYEYDNLYSKYSKKYCLERLTCPHYDRKKLVPMNKISNLTNCIGGDFHDFKAKGKDLICIRCNEVANPKNFIRDSEKVIGERYIILYLRKLAQKYCKSGQIHKFEYNKNTNNNICSYCGYVKGSPITYTDKELFKLHEIIEIKIKNNNLRVSDIISKYNNLTNEEISSITNLFNKIVYKYEKYSNDITKSINSFLEYVQKLLGIDILIGGETYNLYSNIYIINHDHTGEKLSSPIKILEKENKFRIIEKHSHYKRDVLVYTMQKNTKYELFYDLEEKIFLGYRVINKEYKNIKNYNIKLKINYSLKNILILLGFTRQNINIKDFYPEIIGLSTDTYNDKFKNFSMKEFINKIATRRFEIIKKLGIELKKYINRFKHNYNINIITYEATFIDNQNKQTTNTYISDSANNPIDLIYMEYKKKIEQNIITQTTKSDKSKENVKLKENVKSKENNKTNDIDKTHVFLKHMNLINMYLSFDDVKLNNNDIPIFSENINYDLIFKNDFISNIVLNYIIDEIIRLIEYNPNKNIKTNITQFIIEVIINLFNSTFFEISKFNQQLSYFYQILYTSEFYLEIQNNDYMMDAIDYYSNQEEIKNIDNLDDEQREKLENQIEDDNEEMEGMDMVDGDDDIEGLWDLGTDLAQNDNNEPEILY